MQQGDPLGPLLFALVLHPVLAKLASTQGAEALGLTLAYLDDGVLCGSSQAVSGARTRTTPSISK